jgi:hypothetical protein
MRVLSVRADSKKADIASGREILAHVVSDPTTTVMVIRGNGPEVTRIADKAAVRADPFPWRNVVWVTDTDIFAPADEKRLFGGHPQACAVVLDFQGKPISWLESDAQLFDIETAFLDAEGE